MSPQDATGRRPTDQGRPIEAIRWLTLAVAAIAALVTTAAPAGAPPAGTAQVIFARAPVEVVARGQTAAQPLQKGARLSEGDRIRTGKGGAAEVVLGDGSLLRVGELSDLEIDKLDVDAANQPTTSRFNLAAGQARAWVARQVVAKVSTGAGRFSVQSPTAVAAVRQTDFALAQGRVYTFAGVVESRNTDPSVTGFVLCGRNRFTEVEPGKKPKDCQIIPFREKRRLLAPEALAVEGVFLEPNNLDNVALGAAWDKLVGEKMTGTWSSAAPGSSTGRTDAPSEGQGTANVDVIVK
jgi:hypothetical protein